MTNDLGKLILAKLDGMAGELAALRERLDAMAALPPPMSPQADAYLTVEEARVEFKVGKAFLYRLTHTTNMAAQSDSAVQN